MPPRAPNPTSRPRFEITRRPARPRVHVVAQLSMEPMRLVDAARRQREVVVREDVIAARARLAAAPQFARVVEAGLHRRLSRKLVRVGAELCGMSGPKDNRQSPGLRACGCGSRREDTPLSASPPAVLDADSTGTAGDEPNPHDRR
jgi:hypothetical protein